jgi:hypothetical protein
MSPLPSSLNEEGAAAPEAWFLSTELHDKIFGNARFSMKAQISLWPVIIFLLSGAPSVAEEIPLRDFFRNAEIAGFKVSPDGKKLSYLKPWENRMNIFVRDRASGQETRVTSVKDRDLGSYHWKENQTIVYVKDFGGDENFHVYAVDLKTGTSI